MNRSLLALSPLASLPLGMRRAFRIRVAADGACKTRLAAGPAPPGFFSE